MMLQGRCKADRAEVVERDRFATPNSLKSHGERSLLSPGSNTCAITPKLCMPARPVHPSKNLLNSHRHSLLDTNRPIQGFWTPECRHYPRALVAGVRKAPRHEIAGRVEGQRRGCYGDFAAGSGLQRLDG